MRISFGLVALLWVSLSMFASKSQAIDKYMPALSTYLSQCFPISDEPLSDTELKTRRARLEIYYQNPGMFTLGGKAFQDPSVTEAQEICLHILNESRDKLKRHLGAHILHPRLDELAEGNPLSLARLHENESFLSLGEVIVAKISEQLAKEQSSFLYTYKFNSEKVDDYTVYVRNDLAYFTGFVAALLGEFDFDRGKGIENVGEKRTLCFNNIKAAPIKGCWAVGFHDGLLGRAPETPERDAQVEHKKANAASKRKDDPGINPDFEANVAARDVVTLVRRDLSEAQLSQIDFTGDGRFNTHDLNADRDTNFDQDDLLQLQDDHGINIDLSEPRVSDVVSALVKFALRRDPTPPVEGARDRGKSGSKYAPDLDEDSNAKWIYYKLKSTLSGVELDRLDFNKDGKFTIDDMDLTGDNDLDESDVQELRDAGVSTGRGSEGRVLTYDGLFEALKQYAAESE